LTNPENMLSLKEEIISPNTRSDKLLEHGAKRYAENKNMDICF
jgi:hypothetical protein